MTETMEIQKAIDDLLIKNIEKIWKKNCRANKRRNNLIDAVKDFHCDILMLLEGYKKKKLSENHGYIPTAILHIQKAIEQLRDIDDDTADDLGILVKKLKKENGI